MKKYVLILIMFLSGAFASYADAPKDEDRLFEGMMFEISQQLDLSDQQVAQFKPVYKQYMNEIHRIKRPPRYSNAQNLNSNQAYQVVVSQIKFKENILHVQEKYMVKFKNILTPQQLVRLPGVENSIQRKIRDAKHKRSCDKKQKRGRK